MQKIKIFHLYPAHLNLYGDRGNMLALTRRAEWHGLEVDIIPVEPGDRLNLAQCDLLFMGGGQDSDQQLVAQDLNKKRSELLTAVESGMAIFAVCGSYQLLGHYYQTWQGERIAGLALIDLFTEAGAKRLIGNVVINCALFNPEKTLVGFENHAGRTYLGEGVEALGTVITGHGNNGKDKKEGAVYKNVIGTYLHGSLLPKNPWLTDYLLKKALAYRNQPFNPMALDDYIEEKAHQAAIKLATSKRHQKLSSRV